MDATETVLKDIDKRLDTMVDVCTEAATGTVNAKDRENLVKQLRENASYIFEQDANQDYAGRYLFTGYRTDVPLLFEENQTNVTYHIQEKMDSRFMMMPRRTRIMPRKRPSSRQPTASLYPMTIAMMQG